MVTALEWLVDLRDREARFKVCDFSTAYRKGIRLRFPEQDMGF